MNSALAAPPGSPTGKDERADWRPRVEWIPPYTTSAGGEAVELAEMAGLVLDPWQAFFLANSLNERADGKWAALEVGICVARQNGKDAIIEARELAGLFLLGERLITHTAHLFDTSLEHFNRLLYLVESTPDFDREVAKVSRSHGDEGITLRNGQRIRFRTRTKGGGRGFSGDCVILNEAMEISAASQEALFPTVSAQPNPQIWLAGSAVDQEIHENGIVFARVRERGMAGGDPRLMYCEWSVDQEEFEANPDLIRDEVALRRANPALEIRIDPEYVDAERRTLGIRGFARERLGVGDWPDTSEGHRVIDPQAWADCCDSESEVKDPVCLAFDVTPDRAKACVAVAGWRTDGNAHVEVIRHGRGTAWVGETLAALAAKNRPLAIVCDARAGGALLPKMEEDHGLRVAEKGRPRGRIVPATASEHQYGCGVFYDAIDQRILRHRGNPALDAAVSGAVKRTLTDSWAWDKRKSDVDISPLVACTLALWGLHDHRKHTSEVISMADVLAESQAQDERKRTGHAPVTPEDSDWLRGE